MNKNEENSAKSSTWAEEQFRKEADELVKRLETDDRFDDFEPPEELFQKLVVEARDEKNTEIENSQDRLISDRTEEEARNEIEEKLQVEVPQFFYLPDKMDFDSYEIDETAQSVYIRYRNDKDYIYFVIQANYTNTSGLYRNDEGDCLGKIKSDLSSSIEAELWKIEDEKETPMYLVQWDYKNSYYRISGRVTEDEMKKIIQDVMY